MGLNNWWCYLKGIDARITLGTVVDETLHVTRYVTLNLSLTQTTHEQLMNWTTVTEIWAQPACSVPTHATDRAIALMVTLVKVPVV